MKNLILILLIVACGCKKEATEVNDSVTVAADSTDTPKESRMTIVPGESIGKISIGMNAEELEGILGKSDLSDAAMGKAWLTWFSKVADSVTGNELNIYTTYKDNTMQEKVVKQVRITSDEFATSEGLSTGKKIEEFRKAFPKLVASGVYDKETPNPVEIYDAIDDGIAFEFENGVCVGIIIHPKGHKVGDEYITFHPDMQPI